MTGVLEGKARIKRLFRRTFQFRAGLQWYAVALFATLAANPYLLISTFLPSVLMGMLITSIGEELAWRGFALPRLQFRYNTLTSSLIVGTFWTLFYLPLFFTLTGSSQANISFIGFTLSTLSLFFTWMYNNTRGSVLLAYILHASANTWTGIFSIDSGNEVQFWIGTNLTLLLVLFVVKMAGAENLSRNHVRIQEEP